MNKEEVGPRQVIDRFRTKRIYERPDPSDGTRILVDRLWPRGVNKGRAMVHLWMKEIAPSPALRTWFGHARTCPLARVSEAVRRRADGQ
jgi:hypothetical protein